MLIQFPELKYLIIFLKIYLKQRHLNETYSGGMGSFLLMILIVFFLQTHRSRDNREEDSQNKFGLGHFLLDFLYF